MKPYGWIKDKRNEQDYLLTAKKPVEIKEKSNLEYALPYIRDQGNQGACVGFGIGGILTGRAIQKNVYTEWASPRWIYYGGRCLGGYVNQDCGTEPRLALEWLIKFGCLLESAWRYQERFDPIPPPNKLFSEAKKRPLFSYSRVVDSPDGNSVDAICTALSEDKLVAIGSPWFNKWMATDGTLKKPYCWDSIGGGHETFLYGHDYSTEYFNGVNSWGTDWGDKGRFLMPFSAIKMFKKRGGYDAHVLEINWPMLGD